MASFYRCYYHIVWTTKHRLPLISPAIEAHIYQIIREKSQQLKCPLHALDGTQDHIHLAATIPPKLAISDYVHDLKGASSRHINLKFKDELEQFQWQGGYGVSTFGGLQLPVVVEYIKNQKVHHANDTELEPFLERTEE